MKKSSNEKRFPCRSRLCKLEGFQLGELSRIKPAEFSAKVCFNPAIDQVLILSVDPDTSEGQLSLTSGSGYNQDLYLNSFMLMPDV